jgi:predicted nucleotidyltransferase
MLKNRENILARIKAIVLKQEPSAKIYLYGSRARGNALEDSDWDLLILLEKEKITPEIEKRVSYPLYDLEFDTGQVISPMIYSEKEWNTRYKPTPFFSTVMEEGKKI